MEGLIEVRVGECLCPGTPHPDGDMVYLRPRLDLRGGFRVKRRLLDLNRAVFTEGGPPVDMAELEIHLAEVYLDEGIAEWNLVNQDGPIPVTPETLREYLYSDYGRSDTAADRADDLYRPAVFDPLAERALSSLPAMSTNGSTSPTNGHRSKPRKRSKPSSTTSSPTDSTAATT